MTAQLDVDLRRVRLELRSRRQACRRRRGRSVQHPVELVVAERVDGVPRSRARPPSRASPRRSVFRRRSRGHARSRGGCGLAATSVEESLGSFAWTVAPSAQRFSRSAVEAPSASRRCPTLTLASSLPAPSDQLRGIAPIGRTADRDGPVSVIAIDRFRRSRWTGFGDRDRVNSTSGSSATSSRRPRSGPWGHSTD